MRCHAASHIDQRYLTYLAVGIGTEQRRECRRRRHARAHQEEPPRAVARVDERLCCDRPDTRFGPGHDAPNAEPMRLDGHTDLAGHAVDGNDRVGVNGTSARTFLGRYGGCGGCGAQHGAGGHDSGTHGIIPRSLGDRPRGIPALGPQYSHTRNGGR